jgi:hypothetical protein
MYSGNSGIVYTAVAFDVDTGVRFTGAWGSPIYGANWYSIPADHNGGKFYHDSDGTNIALRVSFEDVNLTNLNYLLAGNGGCGILGVRNTDSAGYGLEPHAADVAIYDMSQQGTGWPPAAGDPSDATRHYLFQSWQRDTGYIGVTGEGPDAGWNPNPRGGPTGTDSGYDTFDVILEFAPQADGTVRMYAIERIHKTSEIWSNGVMKWNPPDWHWNGVNRYYNVLPKANGGDYMKDVYVFGVAGNGPFGTSIGGHSIAWQSVWVTGTVANRPTLVWVDKTWTGPANDGGHIWGYDAFSVIQTAIDSAAASATVGVAGGAYAGATLGTPVTVHGAAGGGTTITSGVPYKAGGSLTTAFRLDAGADGSAISGFSIVCNPGAGYYFAVFGRGVNDVTVDSLAIQDTVQGVTNWGGSGWQITDNEVLRTIAASGGGIGFMVGALPNGYKIASDNLIQGNVVASDASAPDYSCPGIAVVLDLRYGQYLSLTGTEDLGGNRILDNTITDGGAVNGTGIEVGVITTDIDPTLIPGLLATTLGMIHDTVIAGNTVSGEDYGLVLYNITDTDVRRNLISNSATAGIYLFDGNSGNVFRYNSISGNALGLYNKTGTVVDATLNWWGDVSGPSGEGTGTGDSASTNVIFSPWLGIDPDGNSAAAGVQMISPMLIIVDDVGPALSGGYLNAAIGGANELVGQDTIEVRSGAYSAATAITDGVNLVSANGSTSISGALSLNTGNVLVGGLGHGFALTSPITVGAGVDASTIHINWNDIYSLVTNGGFGWLDATFNYWGAGSGTNGLVMTYPVLPAPSDVIIGYMSEYNLTPWDAIAFARQLMGRHDSSLLGMMEALGMSVEEARALMDEYGTAAVDAALRHSSDYDGFLLMLLGYVAEIPAGGAGGGGGGGDLASYIVGSTVPLVLVLTDPSTGEPVVDVLVTYSLTWTLEDGTFAIVRFGVMPYDAAAGAYAFTLDTTGLAPGSYVIYLGTDDGRSVSYTIVLTE